MHCWLDSPECEAGYVVYRALRSAIRTPGGPERNSGHGPQLLPLWEGRLGVRQRCHYISLTRFEFLPHTCITSNIFYTLKRTGKERQWACPWAQQRQRQGLALTHRELVTQLLHRQKSQGDRVPTTPEAEGESIRLPG